MPGISVEYRALEKKMLDLYSMENYEAAYSLVREMMGSFPEKSGVLYYFAYCIRNIMGDSEGALGLMEEAARYGYWADPKQLLEEPDLISLHNVERFNEVIKKYSELAVSYRKDSKPILKILEPERPTANQSEPLPIIIALHGNNQTAEDAVEQWKFMSENGWLVVAPQSSQASLPNAYIWNDFSVAIPEIKTHLDKIKEKYRLDNDRFLMAGFSMGAALAAKLTFDQIIAARRLILMGPYLEKLSGLENSVHNFSSENGKVYIVIGENDSECMKGTERLYGMLNESGTECIMDIIPGIAHEYPPEFQELVERNLPFLLKS